MAATNVQAFPGDVTIPGDVTVTGDTILGTATYRKKRTWNRNEQAYVYLGNIQTLSTTGIRLDINIVNANSGYQSYSFQINLQGADTSHAGGKLMFTAVGLNQVSTLRNVEIGYVYAAPSSGIYEYQLWLKDPTTSIAAPMSAYLNCQGFYDFKTGISDVAQGGSAPTNFQLGVPTVVCDISGNVGIGTTTPLNGLDVRSGDGTESDTHATFGKAVYASTGWSGIRLGTPYAAAHDAYCSVIESYNAHSSDFNSILRFKTSSGDNAVATERMRIDADGNVGIGMNNPQNELTVAGNVTVGAGASTTTSAYHAGMLNVIGGGTRALLRLENNNSVGSPGIIFGEGGNFTEDTVPTIKKVQGTTNLAIMTNGKVGIGTTNPIMDTDIYYPGGVAINYGLKIHNSTGSGGSNRMNTILFTDSNSTQGAMGGYRESYSGNYTGGLVFYIGSQPSGYTQGAPSSTAQATGSLTEAMRIKYNGFVGIATNNPTTTLHVVGNGTVSGNMSAANFFGTAVYIGSRSRIQEHVVYANSASNGTLYFEFGQLFWHDDSEVFGIATVKGNPQVNLQNAGTMFSLHKSYGTGVQGSLVVHRTFSRFGNWSMGVSNAPNTNSGIYLYANGVVSSKGYYARALVFNCGA